MLTDWVTNKVVDKWVRPKLEKYLVFDRMKEDLSVEVCARERRGRVWLLGIDAFLADWCV